MPYSNEYKKLREQGIGSISNPYEQEKELPKSPEGVGLAGTGTRSIFNRYSIFFLNDGPVQGEEGTPNGSRMNYFDEPGLWKGESYDPQTGIENLSTANIIAKCSDGTHNGMDYAWSDFLYGKQSNKCWLA